MKKKYSTLIVNKEVQLQLRSKGDKICTLKTKELGITCAPQGSAFDIGIFGFNTLRFYSNRKNQTSLTINTQFLPKFVKLPKVGKPTALRIFGVKRIY